MDETGSSRKSALSVAVAFLVFATLLAAPSHAAPLNPTSIPKYVTPLRILPTMPAAGTVGGTVDYYVIAERQFEQQILPVGFDPTTVWGFVAADASPATYWTPSSTIEAQVNRHVRVKWINDLKAANGNFLPHLFAADVDQQLHWANPPQQCADNTTRPDCTGTSGAGYFGPVPMVVHLHGSHVDPESDGFPESWYLPDANDIPAGYARRGSDFNQIAGAANEFGAAYFQYRNDQRATTLWFHDHSLGITRLNMYAGPAGYYLLRGGAFDLAPGVLPAGAYEIPMIIQARAFLDNGSLDFSIDEGNTMVVNGNTWPFLNVEPRQYRFRFLNASNEDQIELALAVDANGTAGINDGVYTELTNAIWWIGADGGFLPAPANVTSVPLHIAERADVIVDFSGFSQGDVIYLVNGRGDTGTTEQVLRFVVGALTSPDTTTSADQLVLPFFPQLGAADNTIRVSVSNIGMRLLGTVNADNTANPRRWEDPVTEILNFDNTVIWEIHGFDGTHPIHLHQVQFEILSRADRLTGNPIPLGPGETGTKDTVVVNQDEIVRVKALFDIGGRYVWHCHILMHEDDEMMRPFEVVGAPVEPPPSPGPPPVEMTFGGGGGGGCAMVATHGGIKEFAGAYGALALVALGIVLRRRFRRRGE